jgi:hypothetical protein
MKPGLLSLLLLVSSLASQAVGQMAATRDTFAAIKFTRAAGKQPAAWFVEYVSFANEPALRIHAHHYHGWCNGYLYFTPDGVAYIPELTPARKDGFSFKHTEIQKPHPRFAGYEFLIGEKLYRFVFLSDPDGSSVAAKDQRQDLLRFVELALTDFASAKEQFLSVLAGVPLGAGDSSATVLALPAKPVLRILDPTGVADNITADNITTDASASTQRVIGIAAARGGIKTVMANDTPARTTLLSPEVVLFQSNGFPLNSGSNPFRIVASANDSSEASVAFTAIRPEVRLEPARGTKTTDANIDVKGVASGMRNLQTVGVNGKLVPIHQRPDGSFDFGVQKVPLALGPNTITVFTVQSGGQRNTFDTVVMRVPPRPPLTLEIISGGLKNHVPSPILQQQVEDRGVDFELTPEVEKSLRRLGASDSLLNAINDSVIR